MVEPVGGRRGGEGGGGVREVGRQRSWTGGARLDGGLVGGTGGGGEEGGGTGPDRREGGEWSAVVRKAVRPAQQCGLSPDSPPREEGVRDIGAGELLVQGGWGGRSREEREEEGGERNEEGGAGAGEKKTRGRRDTGRRGRRTGRMGKEKEEGFCTLLLQACPKTLPGTAILIFNIGHFSIRRSNILGSSFSDSPLVGKQFHHLYCRTFFHLPSPSRCQA